MTAQTKSSETGDLMHSCINVWIIKDAKTSGIFLDNGHVVLPENNRLYELEQKFNPEGLFALGMCGVTPYSKASNDERLKYEAMTPILVALKPLKKEETESCRVTDLSYRFCECSFQGTNICAYRIHCRGFHLLVTAPWSFAVKQTFNALKKHVTDGIAGSKGHFGILKSTSAAAVEVVSDMRHQPTAAAAAEPAGPRAKIKRKALSPQGTAVLSIAQRVADVKEVDDLYFDGQKSSSMLNESQLFAADRCRKMGDEFYRWFINQLTNTTGKAGPYLTYFDRALQMDSSLFTIDDERTKELFALPIFKKKVADIVLSRFTTENLARLQRLEDDAVIEGIRCDLYSRFRLDAAAFVQTRYFEVHAQRYADHLQKSLSLTVPQVAAAAAPAAPSANGLVPDPDAALHASCNHSINNFRESWETVMHERDAVEEQNKKLKVTIDVKDEVIAKLQRELVAPRPSPKAAPAMIDSLMAEVERLKKANAEAFRIIEIVKARLSDAGGLLLNASIKMNPSN